MHKMPSLFISHGAPNIILRNTATAEFLRELGSTLPLPSAVLVISAHWETEAPRLSAHPAPRTIHDFGGFESELYSMRYPAPGAPALAAQIRSLLLETYRDADLDPDRGLDHGAWIPLMMIYPAGTIPVLQLSVQTRRDALYHYSLGQLLAELRNESVLIVGSGNLTHNLSATFRGGYTDTPTEVREFAEWFHTVLERGDFQTALRWASEAPHAYWNHPSAEHLLPLFVAMGAATTSARRTHHGFDYHTLCMDSYRFD